MDQEAKEPAITRGQNVVYQMPHDWASIAHILAPVLDRIDDATRDLQLLIVCADAEAAAGASASLVRLAGSRPIVAIAATTARRAARLLRLGGAQAVAAAPPELLALVQGSSLKLEQVRWVVLAWVDEETLCRTWATLIDRAQEQHDEALVACCQAARAIVADFFTRPPLVHEPLQLGAHTEAAVSIQRCLILRLRPTGGEAV